MLRELKKGFGWTQAEILQAQAVATRLAADLVALHGERQAVHELAGSGTEATSASPLLRRFAIILAVLDLDVRLGELRRADADRLLAEGDGILTLAGIGARDSKLAFLHLELALRASALATRDGQHRDALSLLVVARGACAHVTDAIEATYHLRVGFAYLRLGHASQALEAFHEAAQTPADAATQATAFVGRIRALRLAGDLADAYAAAAVAKDPWEQALLGHATSPDLRPLITEAGERPDLLAEMLLRAYASRSTNARQALSKTATLKRRYREALDRLPEVKRVLSLAEALEAAYDNSRPLAGRIERVWAAIGQATHLASLEHEMLVLVAGIRWFLRYHQRLAAEAAFAELRKLSLALSNGRRVESLGLLGDDVDSETGALVLVPLREDEDTSALTSPTRRRIELAKTTVSFASVVVSAKVRRAVARNSERERLRADVNRELGEKLVTAFGSLRGLMAKLGQSMTYVDLPVPEPMRLALAALHTAAPAVPAAAIERVIAEDFGKPPQELFLDWSREPVATASIGQVHWAVLPDGREVAVKVQAPGVVEAIKADLAHLNLLKPFISWMLPTGNVGLVLDFMAERFAEELDYAREASNVAAFRAIFAGDPTVVIPEVHAAYSSGRVLTLDFVRGRTVDEFRATATEAERDRAGETIYRTYETALWRHGIFNGDPSPGNFLFLDGGVVAFIDFGSVVHIEKAFLRDWAAVVTAIASGDDDGFSRALVRMGVATDKTLAALPELKAACAGMWAHMTRTEPFRFTPGMKRDAQILPKLPRSALRQVSLPSMVGSFARTGIGLMTVLAQLEAMADYRRITCDNIAALDPAA